MTTNPTSTAAPACYHCGLPVLCGDRYTLNIGGENQWLCCPACKAVAETIIAGGFANYYRYRENNGRYREDNGRNGEENSAKPADSTDFSAFDLPELQQQW